MKIVKKAKAKAKIDPSNAQHVIVAAFRENEKASKAKKRTDIELSEYFLKTLGDKQYLRNVANLRSMYNRGVLPWSSKPKPPKQKSRRYGWNGEVMESKARYIARNRKEAALLAKEQEKKDADKAAKIKAKAESAKAKPKIKAKKGGAKKPVAASGKRIKLRKAAKSDRPHNANAPRKNRSRDTVAVGEAGPAHATYPESVDESV